MNNQRQPIETSLNKNTFMSFVKHCNGFGQPIATFTITIERVKKNKAAHLLVTDKSLILNIPSEDRIRSFKFEDMSVHYKSFEDRLITYRTTIKRWLMNELSISHNDIHLVSFRYELSEMVNVRLFDFNQFVEVVAHSLDGDPFMVGGDKDD